ncbi:MAG: dephospho-CoA kinase [Aquimarina sp.]|nr:dephospho-CoA kinase [Aquimarina sp.]
MKVIGLTGGIGSGKSTVARKFNELGVPVYIADDRAKSLMVKNPEIIKGIVKIFGDEAYLDGHLNRAFIAGQVFSDKSLLQKLNNIVHPAVEKDFQSWILEESKSSARYVIKEAAILFENGGYKKCDYTILVTAPKEERIQRVIERDHTNRQAVLDRIKNQWSDSKKVLLADFVIRNMDFKKTSLIINKIHNKIISSS